MTRRQSRALALGTLAPQFSLIDAASGRLMWLEDFGASPNLLIAFLCNHCPFVKHLLEGFVVFARDYKLRDLGIAAISSNDALGYPEDGPAEMRRVAMWTGFTFPYLYDETQDVARLFQAVCTPDFFLFNQDRRLVYHGQFDGSRPGNALPVTGGDLRAAVDTLIQGKPVPREQTPSVGCSIKWKAGHAPEWA